MTFFRRRTVIIILSGILVILFAISLTIGKVWVPFDVWFQHFANPNFQDPRWIIISDLRLPRTILGIVVGATLGMMGATLQGYTRNPLADPALLGISSMAAFGGVLSLYIDASGQNFWLLPTLSIAGAILGVLLLLALSSMTSSVITFILAGVVLNTIAGAGVALSLNLAPNPWAVSEIINWLMGSLSDRSFDDLYIAIPFALIGSIMIMTTRPALDALSFGEIGARSLGINLTKTRWVITIGIGIATGAIVAVTGVIGFVGLMTPHLMRPIIGARPGGLLLPSALAGSVLVVAADNIVRLVPSATEIKLGVAMAVFGGPFFLMLLISERRRLT